MNFKIINIILLMAAVLFYQNCGNFESANNISSVNGSLSDQLGNIERISQGKILYGNNCAGCHGPLDSSSKMGRNSLQIIEAINDVPQMTQTLSSLSPSDIEDISIALIAQANGGDVEVGTEGRLQFSCTPGLMPKTPLLKLTNREFMASINQILDQFSLNLKNDTQLNDLYNALPLDSLIDDRNTSKEQSQLITRLSTNGYFNVAYRAAELVASNSTGLNQFPGTNGCLSENSLTSACHLSYVKELSSIAFRRPLSQTELNSLASALRDSSLNKNDQLILTFTSLVQMPEFVYKVINNGTPVPASQNLLALTDHEFAARLAFFLTGAPPDSELRNLAQTGQISSETVLNTQINRLLSLSSAQGMVRRLFRESYGYDQYDQFSYASNFLKGVNTSGLQDAMTGELDSFFTELVLNQKTGFAALLTSRYSNMSHTGLRSIYQTSQSGPMTLPAERSGFLNRAAMLAKRSGYRASPIKRGLDVLEHVLCVDVGSPPPSAPTELPVINEVVTTRERTHRTSQVQGTSCLACHGRMNPLGYAFENFDTLGRLRSMEDIYNGSGTLIESLPITTLTTSDELSDQSVTVNDSVELSQELGKSDRALLCFVKHLKKFESRRDVSSADNCQMNDSLKSLYGNSENQGSIVEAIKSLVLSDEFRYWSY